MQYAAQTDGNERDLFQRLENTRDATSSSSVQVDEEMSPGALTWHLCPSHAKEMAQDRTAGGFPWSGQRSETARAVDFSVASSDD